MKMKNRKISLINTEVLLIITKMEIFIHINSSTQYSVMKRVKPKNMINRHSRHRHRCRHKHIHSWFNINDVLFVSLLATLFDCTERVHSHVHSGLALLMVVLRLILPYIAYQLPEPNQFSYNCLILETDPFMISVKCEFSLKFPLVFSCAHKNSTASILSGNFARPLRVLHEHYTPVFEQKRKNTLYNKASPKRKTIIVAIETITDFIGIFIDCYLL